MGQVYTFHETVRGHLHVLNEFPCEDSSASFLAEDGRYGIAIVADGHGSKLCFRSDCGSKAAVEVAMEYLQQFAETALVSEEVEDRFYQDMFFNLRYRQMTIKRLTDTIIAGWHDLVMRDYQNNPPSAEEMGENAAAYEGGRNIAHIYGTTLIAALQMPKCLILIQQGDGRCDVFYADGSIDQPIPWDNRCEDTATTSLCDEDAAESVRSCVIDLTKNPVMACYLGCDGVEDAYRDTYEGLGGSHVLMGGVHTFYKDITCQLAKMGQGEFEEYLKIMLPDFSANGRFSHNGSGDDVSVAGLVDVDVIQQYVAKYEYEVKRYALEEELFGREDELRGKTRKHGILWKRVEEARSGLEDARLNQKKLEKLIGQLKREREKLAEKVEQERIDLEEYRKEARKVSELFGTVVERIFPRLAPKIQSFLKNISEGGLQKEESYGKMQKRLCASDEQIKKAEKTQEVGTQNIKELEKKLEEAQSAFDDYDTKYQAIDAERVRIEKEIADLKKENQE